MKTLVILTSCLVCSELSEAYAQMPAATATSPSPAKTATKTAEHRAANYKGPKVVKDTKVLGTKMLRNSKPAPAATPAPPVKQ